MVTKYKNKNSAYYYNLMVEVKGVVPNAKSVSALYYNENDKQMAFDYTDNNGKRYITSNTATYDNQIKFK